MKLNISISAKAEAFKDVKKKHRKEIETLLNGLNIEGLEALGNGQELPTFDLCTISVPGTNLFCEGNKGIPRSNMPQLKGFPVPGMPASLLRKAKSGKVDVTKQWLEMLKSQDIAIKRKTVDPTTLKAAQNQLVAAKIAMRVEMMKNGDTKKLKMEYFVSKDGYILDGHHGWASILCYNLIAKKDHKMKIIVVDMKIKKLVALANKFMHTMGIAAKTAGTVHSSNSASITDSIAYLKSLGLQVTGKKPTVSKGSISFSLEDITRAAAIRSITAQIGTKPEISQELGGATLSWHASPTREIRVFCLSGQGNTAPNYVTLFNKV